MVAIIFEVCSETFDDENKIVSGWSDVRLSQLGMDQSKQIGERYRGQSIDAVFSSDLKRAVQTATIAFDASPKLVFMDWRLRDCNYGDMSESLQAEFDASKGQYISQAFPSGESFEQCAARVRSFLVDLKAVFDGRTVIVVGHQITKYALDLFLANKPLSQSLSEPWNWQPGWKYQLQ